MVFSFLARRWVAGTSIQDAIERAKKVNLLGISAIINILGEHVKKQAEAEQYCIEYIKAMNTMKYEKLSFSLSLKPTQIGLSISKNYFTKNLRRLLETAKKRGVFVWLDMEGYEYVEDIIEVYLYLFPTFKNLGLTLQANLKRTMKDAEHIVENKGKIRVVKGAYKESNEIGLTKKEDIILNFERIMELLFNSGNMFAIATHDRKLIEKAKQLSAGHHKRFQFQLLMGAGAEIKLQLAREGYDVGEYIPYGTKWFSYVIRRIKENRRAIPFAIASLLEKDL